MGTQTVTTLGQAGLKSRWAREVDVNNPEDIFGITNAQASVFSVIHGLAVEDNGGNKIIKVDAIATSGFNLTDYGAFPVGSTILRMGAAPALYVKVLSSATPADSDWFYATLTVCSSNTVS
ncbi:MAG: hypothetical protein ABR980_10730 [Ignavibacteriaceae bacterium]|jgi:hypothetical protein